MIPIAAAKARPAHARRTRESRAMISKKIVEVAKDNQTALVIVARIAIGTKPRKIATGPRNSRLRHESSASKPSRFSAIPFATACKKGPRARSACIPRLSFRMYLGKMSQGAPTKEAIATTVRYPSTSSENHSKCRRARSSKKTSWAKWKSVNGTTIFAANKLQVWAS